MKDKDIHMNFFVSISNYSNYRLTWHMNVYWILDFTPTLHYMVKTYLCIDLFQNGENINPHTLYLSKTYKECSPLIPPKQNQHKSILVKYELSLL